MQRAALVQLFALFILLSGCAMSPSASQAPAVTVPTTVESAPTQTPAPVQSAGQPTPAQTGAGPGGSTGQPSAPIAPIETSALGQACRLPADQILQVYESAMASLEPVAVDALAARIKAEASCLSLSKVSAERPLLLLHRLGKDEDFAAVLFQQGDGWAVAKAPVHQHSSLLRYIPESREYLIATQMDGSGGYGRLLILRLEDGIKVAYASGTYGHFGVDVLDDDHYLVFGRSTNGAPMASTSNCCQPGTTQTLVVRDGDGFKEAAKRQVPSLTYTFDVFIGALRKGDQAWLDRVATAEAVAAGRTLGLEDPRLQWRWEEIGTGAGDGESRHWSALPPELNGPEPTATEAQLSVLLDQSVKATVKLERINGDWRVTSVTAP